MEVRDISRALLYNWLKFIRYSIIIHVLKDGLWKTMMMSVATY